MTAPTLPEVTLVIIVSAAHAHRLPAAVQVIAAQRLSPGAVEVVCVADETLKAKASDPGRPTPGAGMTWAPSLAAAIAGTQAPWLALCHAGMELVRGDLQRLLAAARRPTAASAAVLVAGSPPLGCEAGALPASDLAGAPPAWHACLLNRAKLLAAHLQPDDRLRPDLAADLLLWRLLLVPGQHVAWAGGPDQAATSGESEPAVEVWRDRDTYASALQLALLQPLAEAASAEQGAPRWLKAAVLQHLSWYFTVDARERAPTVVVDEPMAVVFHDLVRQTLKYVEAALLEALPAQVASVEVRHALWSYHSPEHCSMPTADAYDNDQGLLLLTYWMHGTPPEEGFVVDCQPLQPAYAKWRACNFFRRRLLRQRIVWLPVEGCQELSVALAGRERAVGVGQQTFGAATTGGPCIPAALPLDRVRARFRPGKAHLQRPLPPGWAGWKVRLVKAAARFPFFRKKFKDAWIFADRSINADDNAEHLYRWVRQHHPEINAWFTLDRDSPDWPRLSAEGFRLISSGPIFRLLCLNSKNNISSHTYLAYAGFDERLYGDIMRWKFIYLKHGIAKDDMSHMYNSLPIDMLLAAGPNEHNGFAADDTAYRYTAKEAKNTGLPRHDNLRKLADLNPLSIADLILVMPTWRSNLVREDSRDNGNGNGNGINTDSDYFKTWRELLRDEELRDMLASAGKRLALYPHINLLPYLHALGIPSWVEIIRPGQGSIQGVLVRSAALITDYSSIAFEMAVIRRGVFYYQFDRLGFYSGDHNWRPGYFDYDRDGFGPVAAQRQQLLSQISAFLAKSCTPETNHFRRMERALPLEEESACSRAFTCINEMRF